MLQLGLCVTVNSDDPAYFGGYVHDNLVAVMDSLALNAGELATLARNSFRASFLENHIVERHLQEIEQHCAA
jgi:adenosine deaminase